MASAASVDFLSHLLGPNRQYHISDNPAFLVYALALQAKPTKGSFTRKTNSIDFAYLSTLEQSGAGMTLTQWFQTVFVDPEYDSYKGKQKMQISRIGRNQVDDPQISLFVKTLT